MKFKVTYDQYVYRNPLKADWVLIIEANNLDNAKEIMKVKHRINPFYLKFEECIK